MAGRTFMPTSEFQDLMAVQGRISFCVMHLSESPVRVTLLKTDSNVSRKPDINWPQTDGPWPCCVSSGFDRLKGFDHPGNGHNCGLAQCPTSPIHCTCSLDLGTQASHRTVVRVGHTILKRVVRFGEKHLVRTNLFVKRNCAGRQHYPICCNDMRHAC